MEAKKPDNDDEDEEDNDNEKEEKKKSKRKSFTPPTLEEIQKYVLEKQLKVNAEQFYNYFTEGDWVDSKGNPVKSWKQKILTWNGYSEKQKPPSKSNFKEREYSEEALEFLYSNNF